MLWTQNADKQALKKEAFLTSLSYYRCPRRIRTTTNRTKTCCATITPLDKRAVSGCKGKKNLAIRQIFLSLFTFHSSLYYQEIVVLLTFLGQQILAVDEVVAGDRTILVGQFLLIQRYATTLHHLTHLTL